MRARYRITYSESGGGGIRSQQLSLICGLLGTNLLSMTGDLNVIVKLNAELSHVSSPSQVHPYRSSELSTSPFS